MAQDPNQPTQKPTPEKKGAVRRVLGAFNPNVDVKNDFRPVGQVFHIFVQILASLFVANRILPPNHPFMARDAKFTINDLFHETLVRIDWHDRAKLPQTIFFCAIWGLLASMVLYVVTFVLLFVASPNQAHAADTATTTGMFTAPKDANGQDDLAQQFLHNLVMGQPISSMTANGTTNSFTNTGLIQAAFRSMLEFYSRAILILASFMLLYHIIMLIVNSAWSGKPLEGASQIWGPLRLVIAIALLVPLSGGLNSGQYMVLKVAEMGSALGTNAWQLFTQKLVSSGSNLKVPDNQHVREEFFKMVMVYVCQNDINMQLKNDPNASEYIKIVTEDSVENHTIKLVKKAGAGNFFGGFDECGSIDLPQRVTENTAKFKSDYMNGTALKQASYNITNVISDASVALNEAAQTYAVKVAEKYTKYNDDGEDISMDDVAAIVLEFPAALDKYYDTVRAGVVQASISGNSWDYMRNSSWIMAGAYFMQMSAFQHTIYSAAQTMPKVTIGPVFSRAEKSDKITDSIANFIVVNTNPGAAKFATTHEAHFIRLLPKYSEGIAKAIFDKGKELDPDAKAAAAATSLPSRKTFAQMWGIKKDTIINIFKDNIEDPFAAFVQAGNYFLTVSVTTILGSFAAIAGLGIAGTVFGPFNTFATVGVSILQWVIGMSFYLLLLGAMLGLLMPFVPVTKFLGGVTSWLLAVIEAVIGMPLFALAHLTPGGQGLLDPAIKGYHMLLHIALKPILMIFGMIAAMIVITLGLFGLNMMFVPAMDAVWGSGDDNFIMAMVMFSLWAMFAYQITKTSFGYMDHVSHKTMAWLGGGNYGFERLKGEQDALAVYAAVNSGAKVFTDLGGIADKVGSGVGKGINSVKDSGKKEQERRSLIGLDSNTQRDANKQNKAFDNEQKRLAPSGLDNATWNAAHAENADRGATGISGKVNDGQGSDIAKNAMSADGFSNIGKGANSAAGFRSAPQSGGGKGSLQMGSPTGPSDHDLYDSRIAAGKDNESHYNALGVDAFASADKVNEGFAAKAASLAPENFVNKTPEQRNAAQAQLQNLENSRDTLLGSGLHRTADGGLSKAGLGNNMSSGFNSLPPSPAIDTSGSHVRGVADGKSGGGASSFLKGFGARRTAGAVAVAGGLGLAAGGAMGGGSQAQAAPMTPPTVAGASQPAPANYTTAASSASAPPSITVGLNATPQAASGSFSDRASTGSGDLHNAGDTAAGGGHFGGEQGQSQHNDAGGVGFADRQGAAGGQPTAPAGGYDQSGDTGQAPQIADAAPAFNAGTEQQSSAGDNHAADAGDVAAAAPLAAAEPAVPAPVSPLSSSASGERAPDLRIDTSSVTSSTEGAPKITISGTPPAPQGAPVQQASQQPAFIAPNPAVQNVTGGRPKQTEQGRAQPVQPIGRNNNKDNGGKDKA